MSGGVQLLGCNAIFKMFGKFLDKNHHAWMSPFLGLLDEHLSIGAFVRNSRKGYISPQFYVIFDNLCQTIFNYGEDDMMVDAVCNQLFTSNGALVAKGEFNADDVFVCSFSPLDDA